MYCSLEGNTAHSKHCNGVEAAACLDCDPADVLKIMSLHLMLVTNTVYKHIKVTCTDEEKEVFEVTYIIKIE